MIIRAPLSAVGVRRILALGPILIGAIVLSGWLFGVPVLESMLPGLTTMKANTAVGLLACGIGILLVPSPSPGGVASRWRLRWSACAAGVVALLGALTLAEYGLGSQLGLDELLFADPNTTSPPYPGRMSPAAAVGFACAGVAILLLGQAVATRSVRKSGGCVLATTAHVLTAAPAAVAYLSLTGYAYDVEGLYSWGAFVVTALHTAIAFALLAPAILLTLPELGWGRILAERPAARRAFACLLPLSLLLPFLTGLAVVWGARARIYDPLYGPALFALATASASLGMAWIGMAVIRRAEGRLLDSNARLAASEAELRRLNEGLEERVREAVAAREAAQSRLAHGQRMEALGQLAGGVAHDFNNVMQAIEGGAELMRRRASDPRAVDHLARMMQESVQRGASITRRLLSFARQGELQAEGVDPKALLADLQDVLIHTLGPGIRIGLEMPGSSMPTLLADKGQLETVLVNLATNARDAMPAGGRLTLAAREQVIERVPPESAEACAAEPPQPGHYVKLSVSDSGIGMTATVLARASEPFFTTKPQGKGTGLGLAMARGFAEQSGGSLAIRSAPGVGTTVTLWLPVAASSAMHASTSAAALTGKATRLLVVDDEDHVREVLAESLEERGYDVLRAEGGRTALALLDAGAEINLMLTDYTMPEMDGMVLVEEARRRRPGLPAVLLTGNASVHTEARVAEGGVTGCFSLLRKPVGADQLAERIRALLARAASKEPIFPDAALRGRSGLHEPA